jgi:transcriptional regulator with XRE-family HTH domain
LAGRWPAEDVGTGSAPLDLEAGKRGLRPTTLCVLKRELAAAGTVHRTRAATTRAGVSGSTVSNIERGRTTTPESLKAIRRALKQAGVNLSFGNDLAIVAIAFVDRNAEDDD